MDVRGGGWLVSCDRQPRPIVSTNREFRVNKFVFVRGLRKFQEFVEEERRQGE